MKKTFRSRFGKFTFLKNQNQDNDNLVKIPQINDIVEGKIINKSKSCIFIDLGVLGTGIIYGKEFQEAINELRDAKIGANICAKIIELDNEKGYIELSLKQAAHELAWKKLEEKKEKEEIIEVKILGANKGGLLTEINGIKGFLPTSQLSNEYYPQIEKEDVNKPLKILEKLKKNIGKILKVKIIDLEKGENKFILSEKLVEKQRIKKIIEKKYKKGDVIEGEITGIVNFGVFLDINKKENIKGFIHISELDWQLVKNPSDMVKIGQKVKAKIVEIAEDKIFLSLKQLKKNPWEEITKKLKKHDIIKGKVSKIDVFGALVDLFYDDKKDNFKPQGLCHISTFGSLKKMEENLKVGQEYEFKILLIEPEKYRISLELIKK